MRSYWGLTTLAGIIVGSSFGFASPIGAQQPLNLAYPPENHQTTAAKIFLVGTAPPQGEVLINGKAIARSPAGNFAPSFPLQLGENTFTLRYKDQEIQVKVTRTSSEPEIPKGVAFAQDSFTPATDIARLPGELICFGTVAPPNAQVSLQLSNQTIPLSPQVQVAQLPPNSAVLTAQNQPTLHSTTSDYQGCTTFSQIGDLGSPLFQLGLNGETIKQPGSAKVEILSPNQLEVVEVIAQEGAARTGPSTDYSRLTPLPKGTRAAVTGREGEWLRLDYGAWIKESETRPIPGAVPPQSIIRSISSREVPGATEVIFPLQVPVPVSIQQGDKTFTLTLHNLVAQTDTIYINDNPIIQRLDWQQITPNTVQYTFHLKPEQQWGYDLRYEGTSLILSLQHPPKGEQGSRGAGEQGRQGSRGAGETRETREQGRKDQLLAANSNQPLSDIKILLDPGHGGEETGSKGPTGYPEKDVNLVVSKLLQEELLRRGATVYMTRETDTDVSLEDRVAMIEQVKPAIALSIHYNALPDDGDAINTAGVGAFWYNTQAYSLAAFMHDYLVEKLGRPSYGVFWNNLALTRPHIAPSVLLELGFMINPVEFEWVTNPIEQQKLANAIADGITEWFSRSDQEKYFPQMDADERR